VFLNLWGYHKIHGANRYLLGTLKQLLGLRLLLDAASEPEYKLTEVFLL
jgi:hypothetical protein